MSKSKIFIIFVVTLLCLGGIYWAYQRENFTGANNPQNDQTEIGSVKLPQENGAQNTQAAVSNEKFILELNSLKLSAPIVLNVDGRSQEEYLKSLEDGVAQLKGTALPGDKGNTVIFGHSSYYQDRPGNYKSIFAKNDDLKVGDEISIKSNLRKISYEIVSKEVVDPEDVDVVTQDMSKKRLTLITCWPVYSTKQRLVIVAREI